MNDHYRYMPLFGATATPLAEVMLDDLQPNSCTWLLFTLEFEIGFHILHRETITDPKVWPIREAAILFERYCGV